MELAVRHRRLYDALADEYEARTPKLREVTADALGRLLPLLPKSARTLDVGCGPGLVSDLLSAAGHRAVALDLAPRMAAHARRRAPNAEVRLEDYREFLDMAGFDAIVAFAFIHLFPAREAEGVLTKMLLDLRPGGFLLVGTTESWVSREGLEPKRDFPDQPARFRKHWTREELRSVLESVGFLPVVEMSHQDPFGKTWMDFIVRAPRRGAGKGIDSQVIHGGKHGW